jgi:subtilase family serine protease
MKKLLPIIAALTIIAMTPWQQAQAAYKFSQFKARPPIHIFGKTSAAPRGLSPQVIKQAYNLPATGGHGTIAIIGAYDDKTIESDLNVFSKQFGLSACTNANGCFEKHLMSAGTGTNSGWALETSLDVEWSHAIAPNAKILLVAAKTPSGPNLLAAIDYARNRSDVVAVSMSWGGAESPDEVELDSHFVSTRNIAFFASSGDSGYGVSWPASSKNVVAVGGTSLALSSTGTLRAETAWSGSGGGVSAYEAESTWQKNYSIPKANNHRAVPDVSYDADPASGFSVYKTTGTSKSNWYVLGGTSAGAPQWAAIHALGLSALPANLYSDKASANNGKYFRDIVSGSNGGCMYFCDARKRYDYVTGLGSPLTTKF